MSAIHIISMVGELFSWIGMLCGLPLLIIGLITRAFDRSFIATPIAIVDDLDDNRFAVWSAGGRTCTRALSAHELATITDDQTITGWVSRDDPERMRFERSSPATRVLLTLAIILLAAAALGFIASLLPLFV
jgi:hypothetical protein